MLKTMLALSFIGLLLVIGGCNSSSQETLYIGGIPDQDASILQARFEKLATYLSEELDMDVEYVSSVDYAAVVTAFRQGDVHMAWYGGLTGVQARLAVPNSVAIAQRPSDENFHSVFVAQKGLGITSLADLKGKTFAFGSESSTSGNLMPRYFLGQAGLDPEQDFASVTYSGSHDKTWKLVEAGSSQAGALNRVVWETRKNAGEVDLTKVEEVEVTPPYYDYHWVIRGDVEETFGSGTIGRVQAALLKLRLENSERDKEIMEAFQSEHFIATNNANYAAIEEVARGLGIIKD